MNIEIGKKYTTVNCVMKENNGLIVTVLGFAGTADELGFGEESGERYTVNVTLKTNIGSFINHAGANQLRKIDDDDSRKVVSWKELEDIWTPEKIGEPI